MPTTAYNAVAARARYQRRKAAGFCVNCPTKKPAAGRARCWDCLNKLKRIRQAHRPLAMELIMKAHAVFECHRNIHPFMPADLRQRECWGRLWFEHPSGGGRSQGGNKKLARDIIMGRIPAERLMVLCQLHQIWNADHLAKPLPGHGDGTSKSDLSIANTTGGPV